MYVYVGGNHYTWFSHLVVFQYALYVTRLDLPLSVWLIANAHAQSSISLSCYLPKRIQITLVKYLRY